MKICSIATGMTAAALLGMAGPAWAQAPGEVMLFSQPGFTGPSTTINARRNDVRLAWPVRSVRIGGGIGWRLCTRTNLRDCTNYTQDRADVRFVLRSAEPIPQPPTRPPPGGGASLRGMAAEYFPTPADNRGRIVSCPSGGAACARESADRFCRARGWNGAAFNLQETVNRQNFLADVLCTNTAGGGGGAGPGPAAPLLGTEWRLVRFERPGATAIFPNPDEVFTIRFDPNGSVAMQLACNRGTGNWTSADARGRSGNLTIEGRATTMAACPPGRIDRFQYDIPRIRRFSIDNGLLSLVLDDGRTTYVWAPQR